MGILVVIELVLLIWLGMFLVRTLSYCILAYKEGYDAGRKAVEK